MQPLEEDRPDRVRKEKRARKRVTPSSAPDPWRPARAVVVAEYDFASRNRLRFVVPVREPLVLISQIQRSGGTLLSQLFDDHPQIHAHPQEIKIGYPNKETWPPVDLSKSPEEWFAVLREGTTKKSLKRGYTKHSISLLKEVSIDDLESFPFLFLPTLQSKIFEHCASSWEVRSERDVLDLYMTSYFNAWLDNHNLYGRSKKIVTGFTPRMAMRAENVAKFLETYPDGKLITMIRDPGDWYVSARKHAPGQYGNLERALKLWLSSTDASIDAKERYGDKVIILRYEDLVRETEPVMERLAGLLGIDFHPTLVEPTFNGLPIKADSSYLVDRHGVITEPLTRRSELSADEAAAIDERTRQAHERALALVD